MRNRNVLIPLAVASTTAFLTFRLLLRSIRGVETSGFLRRFRDSRTSTRELYHSLSSIDDAVGTERLVRPGDSIVSEFSSLTDD